MNTRRNTPSTATLALFAVLAWGTSACSSGDTVGEQAGCEDCESGGEGRCSGIQRVVNEQFCVADEVTPDCGNLPPGSEMDVCGVALKLPKSGGTVMELERSANVKEYSGTGAANVACMYPEGFPTKADPSASQNVTMKGIAKIFSNGCQSKNVAIAVYTVGADGA